MQNDDKGLPSIILACQYFLAKMLITLEPQVFLIQLCILIGNIIETLVCKTAIRLCEDFCGKALSPFCMIPVSR